MIFAQKARLSTGWARNVRLMLSEGRISTIETDQTRQPDDVAVDTLQPALANLHRVTPRKASSGVMRNSVQPMFNASSKEFSGEEPGLISVASAIGTPCLRNKSIGGAWVSRNV